MPPNNNPGIISTREVRNIFNQDIGSLNNFMNEAYIRSLDQRNQQSQNQLRMDRLNATTQGARAKQQEQQSSERYEAGLQTAGIAGGLARYAPELEAGILRNADIEAQGRIQDIQDQENMLLLRAQQAREGRDAETLNATLSYLEDLRKYKLDELDRIQQQKNFDRQQSRLEQESGGSGGSSKLSTSQLSQIEELYGVTLPFGTTEDEAAQLLSQSEEGGGAGGPTTINAEYIKTNFSKKQLFKLAKKLGSDRTFNLSRQDDIDRFTEEVPGIVQALKDEGYTDDEILAYFNSNL